jgi:hypothetical protein
MAMSIFVK